MKNSMTKIINLRVPAELLELLEEEAKKRRSSISSVVRLACIDYLLKKAK